MAEKKKLNTSKKSATPKKKKADIKPAKKATITGLTQIIGAKLISGENVIGKATRDGGIDDVMLIVVQPKPGSEGSSLQIMLIPYTLPIFIKRASNPDVVADNIMMRYDVPANITDHYLEKLAGFSVAQPEV